MESEHSSLTTDEPMHPVQIAALRRMSVKEKLTRMSELRSQVLEAKKDAVRAEYPKWNMARVSVETGIRMLETSDWLLNSKEPAFAAMRKWAECQLPRQQG